MTLSSAKRAGSAINGLVTGGANNVLQLGGYGNGTFDVSRIGPQYQNFTTFNLIGPSTWSLTGVSSYAGPVNVNAGVLAVSGNTASASLTTVNAGGTLGGTGTVGRTVVNSLIPFRGLVREISGAAPAERRLNAAIQASFARRGFLRGVATGRGCKLR